MPAQGRKRQVKPKRGTGKQRAAVESDAEESMAADKGDNLDALISGYEAQMRKRAGKQRASEPDYRQMLAERVGQSSKSLESFLAGFETRALPVVTRHSDSASGALIGQAESQFKASMEACADVLDAFQDQCTQEEESLLQSAEEEDTRGALEERFIADWTRLHHGVSEIQEQCAKLIELEEDDAWKRDLFSLLESIEPAA